MDDLPTRQAFEVARRDLTRLYHCEPSRLACDLHPDYFTTRWTQSAGLPFVEVQHHHAHAVACMVEHDLLDREVLAVIFDGTGFGADGTIWGGEILRATMADFERVASLDTFALPGGEAAIWQPNRIALSLLVKTFEYADVPRWLTDRLGLSQREVASFVRMIAHNVNAPRTSSAGRLFDGVAALILGIDTVSYEGEAALWLESIGDPAEESTYPMETYTDALGLCRGDWRSLTRCLIEDLRAGVSRDACAARFHNALASWAAAVAARSALDDVVLGGGCFQNAVLTSRTRAALEALGKCVHVPSRVPANDGGLAVGQLAVALARTRCASK